MKNSIYDSIFFTLDGSDTWKTTYLELWIDTEGLSANKTGTQVCYYLLRQTLNPENAE